jgi:hypothetical protein
MIRSLTFWLCLAAIAGASCDKNEPRTCPVEGAVTLDQQPMSAGKIYFQEPGKPSTVLPIQNGAFKGEITQGSYRVEIRAFRPSVAPPGRDPSQWSGESNYLPSRFNIESTLTAEITQTGINRLAFAVESK